MKKIILSLFLICGMTSILYAQDTGQLWISGNVKLSTSKVKDGPRYTNYRILPEFGYQFAESWGVGLQIGYSHDEYGDERKMKTNGFTVKPFLRASFLQGGLGGFFVDTGLGCTLGKNKTLDAKYRQFDIGFRPGVYARISNNILLTGKFGFLGYEFERNGDRKTNSFGFDFDMRQTELGVSILF